MCRQAQVLINASNLHVGGGVQVAVSFISALFDLGKFDYSVVCSTVVFDNLPSNFDGKLFRKFEVVDIFGASFSCLKSEIFSDKYDVCFTVFGPFYKRLNCTIHICGFAQPWIAYPNNDAYSLLSARQKLKHKLKYAIQKIYFKRYDRLVVEQQNVKDALVSLGFNTHKITVVSNCISEVYDNDSVLENVVFPNMMEKFTLGFIGRPYIHKNIKILKSVNDILIKDYGIKLNFLFTFTDDEMKQLDFDRVENFYSVGSLLVEQCPAFYRAIDALIFPSMLECFSASPIESMKMGKIVISSNYDFVKSVCRDAGFYFDATSEKNIAKVIHEAFSRTDLVIDKVQVGYGLVSALPTTEDRALSYISIIDSYI